MPPEKKDGSSPSEDQDLGEVTASEVAASAEDQDAEAGISSTPDAEDARPESVLDAVRAALVVDSEEASSDLKSSEEGSEDGGQEAEAEADADGSTKTEARAEETDEHLPFHKHPRWQEVTGHLKEAKPKAEAFDRIVSIATENNLTGEEVNDAIALMAALKNDPLKAYEAMQDWITSVQSMAGHSLPEDLAAKVDQGLMDEDSAKEMARLRGERQVADSRQQRDSERTAEQRAQDHINGMKVALSTFETEWKASDPDYSKKANLVRDRMLANAKSSPPKTAEDVVSLAKEAKKQIEDELSFVAPKRKATKPKIEDTGPTSATQEPASYLDAVRLGASKAA